MGAPLAPLEPERGRGRSGPSLDQLRKIDLPGISRPRTVPAAAAILSDEEEILGVEVNGHARAYRLKTLADPTHHVINDRLENQPVSITYCNVSECARTFLGPEGTASLDIGVGGLWKSGLVLRVDGLYYSQKTGERINHPTKPGSWPLVSHPVTRTSWAKWRARYPETDVYQGEPAPVEGP